MRGAGFEMACARRVRHGWYLYSSFPAARLASRGSQHNLIYHQEPATGGGLTALRLGPVHFFEGNRGWALEKVAWAQMAAR